MTPNERLFYDDHLDALSEMVNHNAHGLNFKGVACAMWPGRKPESAYARLKNCLKDGADEKLDLAEVAHLAKITGRTDALAWLCDETEHARPAKRAPADRREQLMREFNDQVERLDRIQKEMRIIGASK